MRIVVQNPQTGWYLQETGAWTRDVRQAQDFPSSADAMNARVRHQLVEATLVFRFEREGYSITVPLETLGSAVGSQGVAHPKANSRNEGSLLIG